MKANKMSSFDRVKWILVAILIVAIVGGNTYFSATALSVRVTIMIIVGVITIGVALTTAKGKVAFEFMKESRIELRKVVWPTRPETVQTTLMIAGIVLLMSLILWGIDSLFAYLVSSVLI